MRACVRLVAGRGGLWCAVRVTDVAGGATSKGKERAFGRVIACDTSGN